MKRILSFVLVVMLVFTLLPVTAQAAAGDKLVALTFDDGPHKVYTKQLLDGLKERGVRVTFFMLGQSAAANVDLVQRAYDEGHEIANHTYTHPNLNTLGASGVQSQLSRTAEVLDQICGAATDYIVRPPYGNANATVLSAMDAPAIIWSVDTNDWKYRNVSHVYNHIINNAYDGAIILCHDIHSTTIPAALQAVDVLLARGYEFVTVSELYRRRGVEMQDGTRYMQCKNNGIDLGPVQAPVITYEPAAGGARVTITSPSDAPVYYTTDGSRLNQDSTLYTGSFVVECPAQIRAAAAFNLNGGRSEEVTLNLELMPCATPKMTLEDDHLTLSCDTDGVSIYYTLDGSEPTTASQVYTGPVAVKPNTMIRAVAGGENYAVSKELAVYYTPRGNLFSDVLTNHWYFETIDILAAKGLMNGVGDYTFAPNMAITRAMVVTMLYRYAGVTLEEGWTRKNTFTDVEDGLWYSDAVEWAYVNDVISGYPDNTFKPNQNISRQEMAKIMAQFLKARGNELLEGEDCTVKFKDGATISSWALDSVNAVVAASLMQGDDQGKLNPLNTATRAEFSAVLLRMMELEEKLEQEKAEEETPEPTNPETPPAESDADTETSQEPRI